jgi:hypothetical protein
VAHVGDAVIENAVTRYVETAVRRPAGGAWAGTCFSQR